MLLKLTALSTIILASNAFAGGINVNINPNVNFTKIGAPSEHVSLNLEFYKTGTNGKNTSVINESKFGEIQYLTNTAAGSIAIPENDISYTGYLYKLPVNMTIAYKISTLQTFNGEPKTLYTCKATHTFNSIKDFSKSYTLTINSAKSIANNCSVALSNTGS